MRTTGAGEVRRAVPATVPLTAQSGQQVDAGRSVTFLYYYQR